MSTLFQKGNPGKPKGTKNKITAEIREKFEQLLDTVSVEQMSADLLKLEPGDRLKLIMGLAEYVTPKLARTQMQHAVPETIDGFEIRIYRGNPGEVPPLANSEKDVLL